MSDYPYNLTAIATHLRELAQSIAKKLDIFGGLEPVRIVVRTLVQENML